MIDVYSGTFSSQILPGANANQSFEIRDAGINFKLRSILWNMEVVDSATGINVAPGDWANMNTILQITANGGGLNTFAKIFSNFSIPAEVTSKGSQILLYRPGQLFFNSFFCREGIDIVLSITNSDIVDTYDFNSCIVIETEKL